MNCKTYENIYCSITRESDGTWTGYNNVTGMPAYIDGDPYKGRRIWKTYEKARAWMTETTQHYRTIALRSGWVR